MDSFKEFFWNGEVIGLYLHRPDMKVSEIAKNTGKSQAEIYRILHSNNVQPNRLKTAHDAVVELSERGWSVQQIADFTGYTDRNVRYILTKYNEAIQHDSRR
jgi:transcriptional regulator